LRLHPTSQGIEESRVADIARPRRDAGEELGLSRTARTHRQRQGKGSQQTATCRALIGIIEEVVAAARKALDDTPGLRGKDRMTAIKIAALREEIAHYCDLGARVIGQARRRVLEWRTGTHG
jgi:hypothetical protein